ncbi:MAG TPA: hypothetical protein DIC42_03565 [Holosporales bacterium]|nr:hypothetical protein [Holosporales bacterium]
MKNKIKILYISIYLIYTLQASTYDISYLISNISCTGSLTLTDKYNLEDAWIKLNDDPTGTIPPTGTVSPSMQFLQNVTFIQSAGAFTLTTQFPLADVASVLGNLNSNITVWKIQSANIYSQKNNHNGQTALFLPSTIQTIHVLEKSHLFATRYKPMSIASNQNIVVDAGGGLYVQPGGSLSMLQSSPYQGLQGNIMIAGILDHYQADFAGINWSWFLPLSMILTEKVISKSILPNIPNYVIWGIGGGSLDAPQYLTGTKARNITINGGTVVVDEANPFKNSLIKNIDVETDGTLRIYDNALEILSLTVSNGTLQLSANNLIPFNPSYPITLGSEGILKFDAGMSIDSHLNPQTITVQANATFDIPGNWDDINPENIYMDADAQNFPISLKTEQPFDLTVNSNAARIAYNTWLIGSNDQIIPDNILQLAHFVKMILLPNVNMTQDLTLYFGQILRRDVTSGLSGNITVSNGATLSLGNASFEGVTANKITVQAGGAVIISEVNVADSLATIDTTAVIEWVRNSSLPESSEFKEIIFDPDSIFQIHALFRDDPDHVGAITSRWNTNAEGQTAVHNRPNIPAINLLLNSTFYSPNFSNLSKYYALPSNISAAYGFILYANQRLNMSSTAIFYMESGSTTQIQAGAGIAATDQNVIISTGATLETDASNFGDNFIKPAWFQAGSIFNTTKVFKDDALIPDKVVWNIFSQNTAADSEEYQQADSASKTVKIINIKPDAYLGVAKAGTFLLTHTLTIEDGGKLEVIPGGEFAFDGGTLTLNNPAYKININDGGLCTVAADNYTLTQILAMVDLEYGAILGFGDPYMPAQGSTPAYSGRAFSLPDDNTGLGIIPEGTSFEFNNGLQTLLNLSPKAIRIRFMNQGILEVANDYPLSLYAGQVLDLTESDFSSSWASAATKVFPYRFFIRSGSTLFLQAGAKIVDYENMYTILGIKAPIIIKTDANIMKSIPGYKRWLQAIRSINATDTNRIETISDYTLNMFTGTHTDINEFISAGTLFNQGAQLHLTSTAEVLDNQYGIGLIPFSTWNIECSNSDYKSGQTLRTQVPSTLETINILDGGYVFSILSNEINVPTGTQLTIKKKGTLTIISNSLNGTIASLYVCAGANLIVDGSLTVATLQIETGANISGTGRINNTLVNSLSTRITPPVVSTPNVTTLAAHNTRTVSSTETFTNPDFATYHIDGTLILLANAQMVNNENGAININSGGTLNIDKTVDVKNLGDIEAFSGATIISNASAFKNSNLLQSWMGNGSTLQTTAAFVDGIGGIGSIPPHVLWNIMSNQSSSMLNFSSNMVTVMSGQTLTLNNNFTIQSGQCLTINGALNVNGAKTLTVASNGILDLTNATGFSGNIIVQSGGLIINPTTNVSNILCQTGSIVQMNTNAAFPTFKTGSTNIQWNVNAATSISAFPESVSVINIMPNADVAFSISSITTLQKIILRNLSSVTFVTSSNAPLIVNGVLEIFKGSNFGTPYITVSSNGLLSVDGDVGNLTNLTLNPGGLLLGTKIITDSATSLLATMNDGDVFEIGSRQEQ